MKKTLLLLALTASLSTQAATQQDIDWALAKIKNSADLQVEKAGTAISFRDKSLLK